MSYLYVNTQGATLSVKANQFQVRNKLKTLKSIPAETLEAIEIFGNVQLTTQCIKECLKRNIPVTFYSFYGAYCGRLSAVNHTDAVRQRRQALLYDDYDFRLAFARKVIKAKIHNQIVILKRYDRSAEHIDLGKRIKEIQYIESKIDAAETIEQVMGFEGTAARMYFNLLGQLVEPDFYFEKRTKRPAKDPFNSMLSFGYSILMDEIYGKIEARGLNPYFGFMHADQGKHPTLASDMMEEWRAVIVDSTVMSLINGHEISIEGFYSVKDTGAVYLDNDTFRVYVAKLDKKFRTLNKYLSYVEFPVTFRQAMDFQISQLVKAIETKDLSFYEPITIR